MDTLNMWAAILLLIGGLVHAIPQLYEALSFNTTPWIQVVVGVVSVAVALAMFFKK